MARPRWAPGHSCSQGEEGAGGRGGGGRGHGRGYAIRRRPAAGEAGGFLKPAEGNDR